LGGFLGTEHVSDIATRNASWFIEWIQRDKEYTQQPYEQVAKVFRGLGQKTKSDDILYAGMEHERSLSTGRRFMWLTVMKLFIGYGFRTYYSIWWILGFTVFGTILLSMFDGASNASLINNTFFTLDTLLPIVELDKSHETVKLDGLIQYYFYFLKVMGFVLGSFLVAGLSGLTKKRDS